MMKQHEGLEVGLFNGSDEVFYDGYKRCVITFIHGETASELAKVRKP